MSREICEVSTKFASQVVLPLQKNFYIFELRIAKIADNYNSSNNEINQFESRRKLARKVTPHTNVRESWCENNLFCHLPRNAALKQLECVQKCLT